MTQQRYVIIVNDDAQASIVTEDSLKAQGLYYDHRQYRGVPISSKRPMFTHGDQARRDTISRCIQADPQAWTQLWATRDELNQTDEMRANVLQEGVTVEEMIARLQKLPAGSRVVMTQEGYYAAGRFADLHDEPILVQSVRHEGEVPVYSLGNSEQSC